MTTPRKVSVLHDNPELPGKKLFLASLISPESKQKHKVHAFKIHDLCEDEEEAKYLVQHYQKLDPDFDIFVGTVGKWLPWVFSAEDLPNIQYANEQLTELVRSHRNTKKKDDEEWKNRIENHTEKLKEVATVEGQKANYMNESCVQMLHRIKQLELHVKRRQEELDTLHKLYAETYSQDEKDEADKKEYPLSEPSLMYYAEWVDTD